jgi:hypothetical protein
MVRKITMFLSALLWVCASTVLASAQTTSSPTEANQAVSSPVAYVYVSNLVSSSGTYQVTGYAAAANGALTPVPGSPFPDSVQYLALNGAWLFGTEFSASGGDQNVDTYSIASNGALTFAQRTQVNESGGSPIALLLDHTGSSLYVSYFNDSNNDCLSYNIDQSTGAITYLSNTNGGLCPVSFTGNNQFVYSSYCLESTPIIFGAKRESDGALTSLSMQPMLPTPPPGTGFCPSTAAADTLNHVAIPMTPLQGGHGLNQGATQLAVYTADSSGNLTTNSTYLNMPKTAVVPTGGTTTFATDSWMSPSGKLLAVSGSLGLQLFHFNGANPITHYTGLLTHTQIDQMYWDNANHLYAISRSSGLLYVFTATPTSVKQAPGSPYSIANAANLIVLPK